MSVSMRPAFRSGRAPAAPPAALAPAALLGALLIALAGAVFQLQAHAPSRSVQLREPARSAPVVAVPDHGAKQVTGEQQHTRAASVISPTSA